MHILKNWPGQVGIGLSSSAFSQCSTPTSFDYVTEQVTQAIQSPLCTTRRQSLLHSVLIPSLLDLFLSAIATWTCWPSIPKLYWEGTKEGYEERERREWKRREIEGKNDLKLSCRAASEYHYLPVDGAHCCRHCSLLLLLLLLLLVNDKHLEPSILFFRCRWQRLILHEKEVRMEKVENDFLLKFFNKRTLHVMWISNRPQSS